MQGCCGHLVYERRPIDSRNTQLSLVAPRNCFGLQAKSDRMGCSPPSGVSDGSLFHSTYRLLWNERQQTSIRIGTRRTWYMVAKLESTAKWQLQICQYISAKNKGKLLSQTQINSMSQQHRHQTGNGKPPDYISLDTSFRQILSRKMGEIDLAIWCMVRVNL